MKNEIRQFNSGATRDTDIDKPSYIKALSPIALQRYVQYIGEHRVQSDGNLRDWDNWKNGIPDEAYLDGLGRHFWAVWLLCHGFPASDNHGPVTLIDSLCGIIFNTQGMLHELLKKDEKEFVCPAGWEIKFIDIGKWCGWQVKTDMNEYLHKGNILCKDTTGWDNHKYGEAPGYWSTKQEAEVALTTYLEKQK